MKVEKQYKYIGANGTIISHVYLLNVPHVPYVKLIADPGYMLQKNKIQLKTVTIPEDEMSLWEEVKVGV